MFRTIERETNEYIVGSVALSGYPESEDVHAFVHRDGWIIAYYLREEPAVKIVNWKDYDGGTVIGTKLEAGILVVLNALDIPMGAVQYYHFRYSDANRLMIVADGLVLDWGGGEDTFRVKLPSNLLFYERSFSHYLLDPRDSTRYSSMYIDGEQISDLRAYRSSSTY